MEEYRFYMAAEKLYHYTWHTLADKIIEESKKIFAGGSPEEKASRRQFLLHTLQKILVSLHPFTPFVTEELWGALPRNSDSLLIVEPWPTSL